MKKRFLGYPSFCGVRDGFWMLAVGKAMIPNLSNKGESINYNIILKSFKQKICLIMTQHLHICNIHI